MNRPALCHICGQLAQSTCRLCLSPTCKNCLEGDVCKSCSKGKKLG